MNAYVIHVSIALMRSELSNDRSKIAAIESSNVANFRSKDAIFSAIDMFVISSVCFSLSSN